MIEFKDITYDDLELVRQWRTSEDVTKYMYTDPTPSTSDQIRWYESLQTNTSCKYMVIYYKGIKVGMVYLTSIDNTSKHCEWGIYIGDSKYQSKGVGAMATYKLMNYVFGDMGMNKVISMVLSYNKSAINLNESFGFKQEGYYKQHCHKNGQFYDMVGFAMLKKDWVKLNEYFKTRFK
ncbi:UDP-4-amino-4,6-dideoxy-N-acetyl-beta-L-altrosamine N-acetyltransferase [bacterium]|jgi:UDP-4-amino-4,6-dideoxy-N-acetyl-beta-L-altrosamine N-acetyltransferase|nr:UDP-4-amino-4,6-dideoxy-N-acetyl-beta-L-altrosamine N-acetyltransferase [bacterium]